MYIDCLVRVGWWSVGHVVTWSLGQVVTRREELVSLGVAHKENTEYRLEHGLTSGLEHGLEHGREPG